MASRFEKFSERARRVLTLAQEEASALIILILALSIFYWVLSVKPKVLPPRSWSIWALV